MKFGGKMITNKPFSNEYDLNYSSKYLNNELTTIIGKLSLFSDISQKFAYINRYINSNFWIKIFLYDKDYCFEKSIDVDLQESRTTFFVIDDDMETVDIKIKEEGGNIAYLKKIFNSYLIAKNKNGRINLVDPEEPILNFLGSLIQLIDDLEFIEFEKEDRLNTQEVSPVATKSKSSKQKKQGKMKDGLPPLLKIIDWKKSIGVDKFINIIERGKDSVFEYDDIDDVLNQVNDDVICFLFPNAAYKAAGLFVLFSQKEYILDVNSVNDKIINNFVFRDKKGIREFTKKMLNDARSLYNNGSDDKKKEFIEKMFPI
jgi:hypothetical protein